MLNLNDLRLFVQVVDCAGFSAAARILGVPKSTLSKRVAALERSLQVRLIQRTSRSFAVTEAGHDLHRHASAMLIEAEAAEAAVRGRLAVPSGTVRLTASLPTAQLALAGLLPALARRHPRIRLEVHASDRFVDIVQEGFDIALRSHRAPLPDSGLVQRRLGTDPVWLVAAPDYLARCGMPATPTALREHDGLLTGPSASWRLQREDGADGSLEVRPSPRLCADEGQILLAAATSGLGIAALPRRLCLDSLADGRLARVLPGWAAGGVTTTLLVPHRRGQLPSVRAVADFLAAHLRAPDGEVREGPSIR